MAELRCKHKLHGILRDGDILEVKCDSRLCGHRPGVVVLHRFNLKTGEVQTLRFKEPQVQREGSKANGLGNEQSAIRSS